MADLQSNVITITTDDLLRLNFTAGEISHIFQTLATDPKSAANGVVLTVEDRQITFKPFEQTDIPSTLGLQTSESFYITEDIGKYKQGDQIGANVKLLEILKNILNNYEPVKPDQIISPSIDFALKASIDNSETKVDMSEDIVYEYEVGTNLKFTDLTVKPFLGRYPWGPDTGVRFEKLNISIDSLDSNETPTSNIGSYENDFHVFDAERDYPTERFSEEASADLQILSGENICGAVLKSSHTKGAIAFGNDRHTQSREPGEDAYVQINAATALDDTQSAATSAMKQKVFRINGYFNSAYISNNNTNFRSGEHFKELPASFVYNGNLQTVYIAIKKDLGKKIKCITNKRTGMPQPFTIDSAAKNIESKSSLAASYIVYKISNKLAESVANEEYQIIYE